MRRKPGALVPLEIAILAAAAQLRDEGASEFHGYQIARHIASVTDRRLLTAYGTLYRALGRLEEMGLLSSRWENPALARKDNRPPRRLYSLTKHGRATAREAIAEGKALRAARARKRWAAAS